MKNKDDDDAFEQANPMANNGRRPMGSKRTSRHTLCEFFAAVIRKDNPVQWGSFTTTTSKVTAYLDGSLTIVHNSFYR